ncbi:elongation factor P 5-aminopentanone reductase [Jeotgalibacillus sp. R-1-5s-1]|uniref:elongation factor P 5-aminopentanone reductase n=1 Tax=Jeotgalibacillus sp. R-1-5s-1 TaxID=2555897 RepID=UPI00106AA49C|nr:SDR family oxidoreductase [Jeotgalibacillus sp. R-1-5s-1]TFE03435.1 SDR family oxidoreductase [Jeotgalibacillus sp. R-1-5s-1]
MSKTYLLLGASGGIGQAVAKKLVDQGHTVIAQYFHNPDPVLKLRDSIPVPEKIIPSKIDLTSDHSVDEFLKTSMPVDGIVHTAGTHYEGMLEDTTDTVIDELWNVHLKQPVRIIRHMLPALRQRMKASIVIVSSIWGETGASYEVMYSAVKGAQIAFVKALGKELAPSGIRVNAVSPGAVATKMTIHYSEEERQGINGEIPLGRMGKPEEIADAVLFLLSSSSSYITSQVLSVNGGWHT